MSPADVTVTAQIYLPRPWWKLWTFAWQTAFTIDKDFKVDLLALMFKLIKYLLTKNPNALLHRRYPEQAEGNPTLRHELYPGRHGRQQHRGYTELTGDT